MLFAKQKMQKCYQANTQKKGNELKNINYKEARTCSIASNEMMGEVFNQTTFLFINSCR
jgi:hypothetical protein